ncbi:MAG TPA: DUF4198 domain-containing protein [Pirellulales bacterium]|nr:DUF4198 domain-containing protein [Pirellulales bacterium]
MNIARTVPFTLVTLACCAWTTASVGHDTWVETNTNLVRTGDVVFIELRLGNHGNDHRDFKLASKVALEKCTWLVRDPEGKEYDLKPQAIDKGYAPNEGYWSARFVPTKPGLYSVVHTADSGHLTTRGIKSGKTYFLVSDRLDKIAPASDDYTRACGHSLEIVAEANPVAPMGPGVPIKVRAMYRGKPMPEARVSFVPQGVTLAEGFDSQYEQTTDSEGLATFTPREGNRYLIVVHRHEPDEKGPGFDQTHYSATLTVYVPQICPCCD